MACIGTKLLFYAHSNREYNFKDVFGEFPAHPVLHVTDYSSVHVRRTITIIVIMSVPRHTIWFRFHIRGISVAFVRLNNNYKISI